MSPARSSGRHADGLSSTADLIGDALPGPSRGPFGDGPKDDPLGQLGVVTMFATTRIDHAPTAFSSHFSKVGCLSPHGETGGVATRWVVAPMLHHKSWWHRAVDQLPSDDVCPPIPLVVVVKDTVSTSNQDRCRPRPTSLRTARSIHPGPESLFSRELNWAFLLNRHDGMVINSIPSCHGRDAQ